MAGMVCTITEHRLGTVKKITFDWLSDDAAGTATGTTPHAYDGELIRVITDPDGGGTAPDLNYDVTLTDADGHDLLFGAGADRHNVNTEYLYRETPGLGCVAHSRLTLNVAAAGNAKGGLFILWLR